MNNPKLDKLADLLLDTGKRNNLINFKDSKSSTVDIVAPDFETLFDKTSGGTCFEVYDPNIENEDDDSPQKDLMPYDDYIKSFANKLKRNQFLLYNKDSKPMKSLRNIKKRAKTIIEETGVNTAFIVFGLIEWTESEESNYKMKAPLLLLPISIENQSAAEPYFIKIVDDDIVVNPTFRYKLQSDYGINLPEFSGNISEYIQEIQALLGRLKWTVSLEVKIGIFSFLKINMYKDLKNNSEKIAKNSAIRALLGDNSDLKSFEEKRNPSDLLDLHNVVDADSSQAEAISLAKAGKSFVLQGPPGTGKSQTITNIIAECLHDNKKVLFVSEKLAALNVVFDKLKKVGLEDFCLELHSHKANKKQIIDTLCRTLRLPKSNLSDKAANELLTRKKIQKKLDDYAMQLHQINPVINTSLYNLYEEFSRLRETTDIDYLIDGITNKGEDHLLNAVQLLTNYSNYLPYIGNNYKLNAWYGYVDLDANYDQNMSFKSDLKTCIDLCEQLNYINNDLSKYALNINSIEQLLAAKDFFECASKSEFYTQKLFAADLDSLYENIKILQEKSIDLLTNKNKLSDSFDEDIYKLNGHTLYKIVSKQFSGLLSRLFSKDYSNIVKSIKSCLTSKIKMDYNFLLQTLIVLSDYQRKLTEFKAVSSKIKDLLGTNYNEEYTNFEQLSQEINVLQKFIKCGASVKHFSKLCDNDFLFEKQNFKQYGIKLKNLLNRYSMLEERLQAKYNKKILDIRKTHIEELSERFKRQYNEFNKLDNWCNFSKLMKKLRSHKLNSYIDYCIENTINNECIVLCYKKQFYHQWIENILHSLPALTQLPRVSHDEVVNLFKEKDKIAFKINQAEIKSKLSARRPSLDMIAQGSAISILLHEAEKKRKQKGIRQLLLEIGDLTQLIKPCFLMSPLSVSTFLSPDIKFDVVIFDEASQIFPQDSIGAIYRGKQLIVVGDSKQMPPSNFFNTYNDTDNDDEEDITDYESVLDIYSAIYPQCRLKWHYRSKYEQLIAFSNKNYYDNELVTFPSSKSDTSKDGIGIDYYNVIDGIFDRKSKTNVVEAEKIVDLVFEHFEKYPKRSLGVVAFSISQQSLIERLIAKRRQQDISKEVFFNSENAEPFFVKNLETVQGDERDTIIFSIAYAKDTEGRLLLNFGPINRNGGERRLNVAVTRAKCNLKVVSSMHFTDIDLSRTKSVGSRLLREYLDYAENGAKALERSINVNSFEEYDSEFEMEVCEFLRKKGFDVDTQVGCSTFKIDLALKRPNSSDYVLAIECDGASYHSSKSARDRDRLRQEILEGMGWTFYRIWSTDWFKAKTTEQERLCAAALDALNYQLLPKKIIEDEAENFNVQKQPTRFEFPFYDMADVHAIAKQYGYYNKKQIVRKILELEMPMSEEWLLKRIAFLYYREKVTSVVLEEFECDMASCDRLGIIRKNNFLYLKDWKFPSLRVPRHSDIPRDIKYISLEELANGMYVLIKHNISVEKNGLFKLLTQQLGFSRIGESIYNRLESALTLIEDMINDNCGILSLK